MDVGPGAGGAAPTRPPVPLDGHGEAIERDGGEGGRVAASTVALALAALCAFAANSLICRVALASGAIDPVGFTAIRIAAGALTLVLLAAPRRRRVGGSWASAACLFTYAAAFSFAYVSLTAGTGALVLFAAVQLTMLLAGLRAGERPGALQWAGFAFALGGLAWLVAPGLAAPSPIGAVLMAVAGAAWGVYSLRGRNGGDPLAGSAGNFARALALAAVLVAVLAAHVRVSPSGVLWAVLSGAATSGLGYVAWYAAVRHLSATRAAVIQLAVPVLAASGAVVLLGEPLTHRLVLAGAIIVGGVALAVLSRQRADLPARG